MLALPWQMIGHVLTLFADGTTTPNVPTWVSIPIWLSGWGLLAYLFITNKITSVKEVGELRKLLAESQAREADSQKFIKEEAFKALTRATVALEQKIDQRSETT